MKIVLELIAMLTMLIDHIGLIFFPDVPVFRMIGRLALPLYAFGIVQGYKYTKNLKNYQKRLILLALLSQIPFSLLVGMKLNVIFTFLFCLWILTLLESKKKRKYLYIAAISVFVHFFSDYGMYAIALVLIYRYVKGYHILVTHILLDIVVMITFGWIFQPFSSIASLLIVNREKLKQLTMNRWLFRAFYPAHLTLIVIVETYLTSFSKSFPPL